MRIERKSCTDRIDRRKKGRGRMESLMTGTENDRCETVGQSSGSHDGMAAHYESRKLPVLTPCADCVNCLTYVEDTRLFGQVEGLRCAKGHWRSGKKEFIYPIEGVLQLECVGCADYVSGSKDEADKEQYLRMLRKVFLGESQTDSRGFRL